MLVEALACGNRLVSTALPGVLDQLAPHLGEALHLVDPPRLEGADVPVAADLPAFVQRLEAALDAALDAPPPGDLTARLAPFRWGAVYARVEPIWRELAT